MLEIQGRVVPLASNDPERHFLGRVRSGDDGIIDTVARNRIQPPNGVRLIDVGDAYIYPGLIDLHSHIGYASLPLWAEPTRTEPFAHHDIWPNARSYKPSISWPSYALIKGAPEALLAYAQVRALGGGTTSIQGWPPANRRPANQLIRNVDDEDLGTAKPNLIRTSTLTLDPPELRQKAQQIRAGDGFIYHCAEGRAGSKAAHEFSDAAQAGCLRSRLIAIHCTAIGEPEFSQWRQHAALADDPTPGGVVWSPFSNLWLYNETTDIEAAKRQDLGVCLGTDWGPSGTKNLLGELKVADLWSQAAGLGLDPFDLAQMVTSTPGDLLGRCWPYQPGRLEPGRLADITILAARHNDPWTNLVMAHEQDVLLVVVGGEVRYGTRQLMRASGQTQTTTVPVGRQTRHVVLRNPERPEQAWTWKTVLNQLDQVSHDPSAAIESGQRTAMAALEATHRNYLGPLPGLVLEPDMPAAQGVTAGPPPPGAVYTVPKAPSLTHDKAWHRSIRGRGFEPLLEQLAGYY